MKGTSKQVKRKNRKLEWVKLGLIRVSDLAQRQLNTARVDHLLSKFDIDKLGNPEVSHRGGYYYVMDGQHRVEAVKRWLGDGWEDQHIECWVASDMTETEEAENFLVLNDTLNVSSFQKFRVAVRAGRPTETAIYRIVEDEGLNVSYQKTPGGIFAVGTLRRIYTRDGAECLHKALRIARDAYGDPGLCSKVLDGLGMLCGRYDGVLDEKAAKAALSKALGGVNGLLGKAETLRQKTGNSSAPCVAAAAVEIINRGRGGKKLPDWWKT